MHTRYVTRDRAIYLIYHKTRGQMEKELYDIVCALNEYIRKKAAAICIHGK